jgi:hypothetical protein
VVPTCHCARRPARCDAGADSRSNLAGTAARGGAASSMLSTSAAVSSMLGGRPHTPTQSTGIMLRANTSSVGVVPGIAAQLSRVGSTMQAGGAPGAAGEPAASYSKCNRHGYAWHRAVGRALNMLQDYPDARTPPAWQRLQISDCCLCVSTGPPPSTPGRPDSSNRTTGGAAEMAAAGAASSTIGSAPGRAPSEYAR